MSIFPFYAKGEIVKGFGRGSASLGFPTANLPESVVDALPSDFKCGIYYGWANVDNDLVHEMVMSVGYNPYFENTKKTMETHILHPFNRPLHGCLLKVCILGYIRSEANFKSLEDLKEAIQADINYAKAELQKHENLQYCSDKFFADG